MLGVILYLVDEVTVVHVWLSVVNGMWLSRSDVVVVVLGVVMFVSWVLVVVVLLMRTLRKVGEFEPVDSRAWQGEGVLLGDSRVGRVMMVVPVWQVRSIGEVEPVDVRAWRGEEEVLLVGSKMGRVVPVG